MEGICRDADTLKRAEDTLMLLRYENASGGSHTPLDYDSQRERIVYSGSWTLCSQTMSPRSTHLSIKSLGSDALGS